MDEFQDIEAQGAPASAEALKSIVARHQRARTRILGIALAVAVVAGPVAGWAVAQTGQGGGQRVASGGPEASRRDANAPTAAPAGGAGFVQGFGPLGGPNASPARHLFTRTTADGITIRAYRTDPPAPAAGTPTSRTTSSAKPPAAGFACAGGIGTGTAKPVPPEAGVSSSSASESPGQPSTASNVSNSSASANAVSGASATADASSPATGAAPPPPCPLPPDCKPTPFAMAELSNDAAVGQGPVPLAAESPSTPLSQVDTGIFGVAESSPAMWVGVQTGPGVATVRLRLPSGATDEMAPVEGVAVLAHGTPKPPPDGTVVEALDASGKVIGSQDVTKPQGPQKITGCAVAVATASASGSSGPATASAPPTTR